jgi:hypothetical protein
MQSDAPEKLIMADELPLSWIREIGGVFRLGSGVLGKSAIAIGILIAVGGIAVFRLHSDTAILIALGLIVIVFFLWFFPVLRFCKDNPAAALLDGAEWQGYQRLQMEAKNYTPTIEELGTQIAANDVSRTLSPYRDGEQD